jgi:hypothetical protein
VVFFGERAKRDERRELCRVSSNHAYLFAFCQQRLPKRDLGHIYALEITTDLRIVFRF